MSGSCSRVSVVIAAHNAARFLRETLDSVLSQDHPRLEVVVIDDGSHAQTSDIIGSFGSDVVAGRQDHRGLGAAQNHGIRLATGTHLSFIDADDLWAPDKTSLQLSVLDERLDVDLVFGMVEQFATAGPEADGPPRVPDSLRILPGYSTGTLLLRRVDFERVGPFSETITMGPFIDWYGRAVDDGLRPHLIDRVVMRRRIHSGNMGRRLRAHRRDYLQILKRTIDRRREETSGAHAPGGPESRDGST